jgi:lysophospholipase L1-like esterase
MLTPNKLMKRKWTSRTSIGSMRTMRHWLIGSLVAVASTMLALGLIEAGARLYYMKASWPIAPLDQKFPVSGPAPYVDADYFDDEFLREHESVFTVYVPHATPSFTGAYFNFTAGERMTTDRPETADSRVLLFGGSTMVSGEVPDWETIPSHLQRLFNDAGRRVQVINRGVLSMDTAGMTSRLLSTTVARGDVVIFYGGVNDVYNFVFHDRSARDPLLLGALMRFRSVSAFARLVAGIAWYAVPRTVTDSRRLARNTATVERQYSESLVQAATFVAAHGGRFYNVLQPHIYTLRSLSAYERRVVGRENAGLAIAFQAAYPSLKQAGIDLAHQGVVSFDISDALDRRPNGEELYLDFCHVNHMANAVIADRIYDAISAAASEDIGGTASSLVEF